MTSVAPRAFAAPLADRLTSAIPRQLVLLLVAAALVPAIGAAND